MLALRLGVVLADVGWIATVNCGGSTRDGGPTEGAGKPDASGGAGAGAGYSGGAGAGSGGEAGSAGSGTSGSGGSSGFAGTGMAGATGSGAGPGQGACSFSAECMIRPRSCCGSCGAATREDVIAVNVLYAGRYSFLVCGNEDCPACYRPSDPNLLARCENAACEVVDLSTLPLTECASDLDCRVRTAGCCECGGNVSLDSLIAIRRDAEAEFQRLSCDGVLDCDACVPHYPELARAICVMGRCTVTGTSGTTPPPP